MAAYYNEFDPFAAAWLRELIKAGHIADGIVDDRSILDVEPEDLKDFTQCHFFAGIGGWSFALRQAMWSDDRHVWTGSCPCQPFSNAGEGKGHEDERHLWPVWFDIIRQCRPATLFGEQVASAVRFGWLDHVFTDLETEDYACAAAVLPACGVGAPHLRQRIFWLANASSERQSGQRLFRAEGASIPEVAGGGETVAMADPHGGGREGQGRLGRSLDPAQGANRQDHGTQYDCWSGVSTYVECRDGAIRQIPTERAFFPVVDGVQAGRVGILRGAGNAIVPQVAAEFIGAYLDVKSS